jgi:transposase
LTLLHQTPETYGHARSRWSLETLLASCPWLKLTTVGGLSRLLLRLGIRRKRARDYLRSPDPAYAAKVAYTQQCWLQVLAAPERRVLLYLDEFGFERQPSLAPAYEQRGRSQPLARRSYRANTRCRGLGALNALTGQVTYLQRSHITVPVLAHFYAQLVRTYPQAEQIYVVLDNWPVHAHPQLLLPLQAQQAPWPFPTLAHWPMRPRDPASPALLPIQLIPLPTYAPWLNPIEKLWRWLRQQVLHLHRQAEDWDGLKQRVLDFMAQFEHGSHALLDYVGLLPH